MARQPIKTISAAEAIQPVAQPTQTYVRPAEPARSSLQGLAEGLATLDSGLSGFLGERRKKQDDADRVRAQAEFNKNHSVGWAEAVRRGLVPANASPVFMRAYKEAQGNLEGIRLRDAFTKEYMGWSGRASNDQKAFGSFLSDFVSSRIGTDDVDVLRGLNPHIQALTQESYETFNKESASSIYKGALNTGAALMNRDVDDASEVGLSSGKGTDYDGLWARLLERRNAGLEAGQRGEDLDARIADAIAAKAIELRDPKLLDLLDRVTDGSGIALKDNPSFRDMKQQAIDRLETIGRQRESDMAQVQKAQDRREEDAITASVIRLLAEDPSGDVPEDTIRRLEKYNPKARTMIVEARKTLMAGGEVEDRRELLEIQRDIAQGATQDDILQAVRSGRIKDPQTLTSMLDRVEKYRKARQEGSGILTNQTAKRFTKMITERAGTVNGELKVVADMFGNYAMSDESLEAIQDFEAGLMQWDDQNPNASVIEREKFINEMGETILQRISPTAATDDPSKYRGDADIQREDRAGTLRDAVGGGAESPAGLYEADKPPLIDRLPEALRRRIDDGARKSGMSPEEYNERLWRRMRSLKTGEPEAPLQKSSYDPSNPFGAVIDNAVAHPGDAGNRGWLRYSNKGATRNRPLSDRLVSALSRVLPGLGVTMEVFSGGQATREEAARGEGGRTGSVRHDHGDAADVFFYKDGRRLDWSNPRDLPIFQEIVRRAKRAGLTGFGAGDGYMQRGSMHIGFGSPGVWGAGGSGDTAPQWLRDAYSGDDTA